MKKVERKFSYLYENTKTGDRVEWSYQCSETETTDDNDLKPETTDDKYLKPKKGVNRGVIVHLITPLITIAVEAAFRLLFGI